MKVEECSYFVTPYLLKKDVKVTIVMSRIINFLILHDEFNNIIPKKRSKK